MTSSAHDSGTVAVLGGCGFIGHALARRLLGQPGIARVVVIDNLSSGRRGLLPDDDRIRFDGPRDARTVRLSDLENPTTVYYLCGSPFVPDSFDDPDRTHNANVGVLHDFLAHNDDIPFKLVYASSGEVYGNVPHGEADEKDESGDPRALSPYARSRIDAEGVLRQWADKSRRQVVALRLFNVLGPAATQPYFVPEMIRQIVHEDQVRHGRLDTVRDFVAISDTVEAFIAAARTDLSGYTALNVSTGRGWSMRYVLDQLLQIAGRPDVPCVEDPGRRRPVELDRLVGSPARADQLLGWKPRVDLSTALRTVHDAYLKAGRWPYEDRVKEQHERLVRANQDTPYRGFATVGA